MKGMAVTGDPAGPARRRVSFRSHFGLDAFCCMPGIEGAHEKGGMEGEVLRLRRNRLVPVLVPKAGSLAELNTMIDARDADDDSRRIGPRARTAGQDFAAVQPRLKPLPVDIAAARAQRRTCRTPDPGGQGRSLTGTTATDCDGG